MKKNILLCTIAAIVAFSAGYFTCLKVNTDSVESFDFKVSMIMRQDAALRQADKVMWNNALFDTDGSDDMADYLEMRCEIDSIWDTQL